MNGDPRANSAALFREFVPASVRRALGEDLEVPVISSALVAEHKEALGGPVVELDWPGTAALLGALRAMRHGDAIVAVRLPDTSLTGDPRARGQAAEAVVGLAEEAGFDRPLILVGGVASPGGPDAKERFADALFAAADAGLTSLALRPADLDEEILDDIFALTMPIRELGIGIEVEFEAGAGAAFLLAQLDEAGLPLAAVRGAGLHDELGGGLLVVDPTAGSIPEGAPLRVNLDAFIVRGLARAVGPAAGKGLLESTRQRGASRTLALSLKRLATFDEARRARVEAFVYAEIEAACVALGANGTAGDLHDALTSELAADAATAGE